MISNSLNSNQNSTSTAEAERHRRHELNNYFSAILGSLQMCAMGQIDDRSRRMLENAQDGVNALQEYLNVSIPNSQETEFPIMSQPDNAQKTVLIVEDNNEIKEMTAEILKEAGYKVITANNSEDALNKLSPNINLIFTDIIMPGNINGVSLMKRVQSNYPDIKILMTTGTPDVLHFQDRNYISNGKVDVLYKPYMPSELLQKIQNTFDFEAAPIH